MDVQSQALNLSDILTFSTPEHMTILQTTMLFYFYKDTN